MKKILIALTVAVLLVGAASLALYINPTDTGTLSAEEVTAFACNVMQQPYDSVITASSPQESARVEIRNAGNGDSHTLMVIRAPDGSLLEQGELLQVGGVLYGRDTGGTPDSFGPWERFSDDVPDDEPLPCLLPASEVEDGAMGTTGERHIVSHTFLSEREGSVKNEFWADSTGRPVRGRKTTYSPEGEQKAVLDITYSGYGDPNLIEAPVVNP